MNVSNHIHNYGIFFKHPKTEKHGLVCLSAMLELQQQSEQPLDKWYINIEVVNRDDNFDPERVKEFLDKHWNSQKKLLKLQECGSIWDLATSVKECDSELSHFRAEYKGKMGKYEDERTGEIIYYIEQKNCPDAVLKVPLYATFGKDQIENDCRGQDWEYAFVFDENTKKFEILKFEYSEDDD